VDVITPPAATSDGRAGSLVVVGELNADVVVALDAPPVFGQAEQLVRTTAVVLGSSSAITACGAARMGVPTSLVSVVGDDLLGRFLLDELRAHGVDTSGCRVDAEQPTGISTILAIPGGDRSILTALGAIGAVTVDDVPAGLLTPGSHLHVGSYFLQHGLHGALTPFLAECRARGLTTSVDPNDDPAGQWRSGLLDVLPHVDVFFCNADEAMAIAGVAELDEAARFIAAHLHAGAELVVKLGGQGARVDHVGDGDASIGEVVAAPAARGDLVDTVGAGDSLAAGYLAARLRGRPPAECLRVGVANGTASTRAAGGTAAQLSWDEAVALTEIGPPASR
jgi:sugar/nucleoside kinase (ribokinase family)